MLTKIVTGLAAALLLLPALFIAAFGALLGGGSRLQQAASTASVTALADIPPTYLALYRHAAATCPGLEWSILAAIGKIETNHGRLNAPGVHSGENSAGAGGPMQFLQPTFTWVLNQAAHDGKYIPPGGATPPSRYNAHDAIYAASFYLCMSGAENNADLYRAIFTYNHADWYVRKVLNQADQYRAATTTPRPGRDGWVVPVAGRCTSGFGPRGGKPHHGQDIAAPIGTPIVAASAGTILDSGPASGYGLWIRIQHADGITTTYGHNHRNLVGSGATVHAGQPIAEVGNRGESTGPHLHFQIERAGSPVNLVEFYRQRSAPPLCGSP
ncbi:peptidoglycan DD-metalloendopeptidase family protein [Saccharopolyspora sp. NPDC003752]